MRWETYQRHGAMLVKFYVFAQQTLPISWLALLSLWVAPYLSTHTASSLVELLPPTSQPAAQDQNLTKRVDPWWTTHWTKMKKPLQWRICIHSSTMPCRVIIKFIQVGWNDGLKSNSTLYCHPFKLNTIDIEAWSPFPPMFGGVSGVAEPGTYSATAGPSHQWRLNTFRLIHRISWLKNEFQRLNIYKDGKAVQ